LPPFPLIYENLDGFTNFDLSGDLSSDIDESLVLWKFDG
jgi:hypothetical protein